ncbi:hypothetical protein BDB01DRAFT_830680 [Pilobolus umbonatus]|nr:hypothetical protein BDB01DRAFT_830680 [Pilobolus umbonatus]
MIHVPLIIFYIILNLFVAYLCLLIFSYYYRMIAQLLYNQCMIQMQPIIHQIKETIYECWICVYSPVFWTLHNHWDPRSKYTDILIIDDLFRFDINSYTEKDYLCQKENRCDKKEIKLIQSKPKGNSFQLIFQNKKKKLLDGDAIEYRRSTKSNIKHHMLLWKQKNQEVKRSLLRRLNSGHSDDDNSTSIMKSFTLKIKRQSITDEDGNLNRPILSSFRRKDSR